MTLNQTIEQRKGAGHAAANTRNARSIPRVHMFDRTNIRATRIRIARRGVVCLLGSTSMQNQLSVEPVLAVVL